MFKVVVSKTFQKQFEGLPEELRKRIKERLKELEVDPFSPRSKLDIKLLKETNPQKHRLRIGDYRIVYLVENESVKVIELFTRGRGYRE
jgi:mRNA interferase RelE/StbE